MRLRKSMGRFDLVKSGLMVGHRSSFAVSDDGTRRGCCPSRRPLYLRVALPSHPCGARGATLANRPDANTSIARWASPLPLLPLHDGDSLATASLRITAWTDCR